jgi:hypothetical protein
MEISADKTKVMVFTPSGHHPASETFHINGDTLERVNEFKYLGHIVSSDLNFNSHFKEKLSKARVMALQIYSLMRQLQVWKPRSIISFFSIFVESQVYGLQFAKWENVRELESTFVRYLKSVLSLPRGTSSATLLRIFDFSNWEKRVFNAKLRFLERAIRYNSHSPFIDTLVVSRTHFRHFGIGWFSFFREEMARYGYSCSTFDFIARGNEIIVAIVDANHVQVVNRVQVLPSAQFFNTIFQVDFVYPEMVAALSEYGFECFRLLVMFLTGVVTWSIFRGYRARCDQCNNNMNALHLITCPAMYSWFQFMGLSVNSLISRANNGEWRELFDELINVIHIWSIISPNAVPQLREHIASNV